jgi:hypothetical protein
MLLPAPRACRITFAPLPPGSCRSASIPHPQPQPPSLTLILTPTLTPTPIPHPHPHRCFAFTVLFGLYHGLVVFPVLLALGGSKPYAERVPGQSKASHGHGTGATGVAEGPSGSGTGRPTPLTV